MTDRKPHIQGEGDKESDRRYREGTKEFVQSPEGKEQIKHAGDVSEAEARRLREFEEKAKSHAKDEDPAVRQQTKR